MPTSKSPPNRSTVDVWFLLPFLPKHEKMNMERRTPVQPHPRQPTTSMLMQENPPAGTSYWISTPDVTQHTSFRRDKKKLRRPNIDMRYKYAKLGFGQDKWTYCVPFDCEYSEF